MENMNIAIVSDDKNYARALGMAVLNVCRTLIINIFNREEFAVEQEKYCVPEEGGRFSGGFDLVMWDGDDIQERGNLPHIYLVEHRSLTCRQGEQGRYCIYRYSPAQQIVSDLFEIYAAVTGRRPANVVQQNMHVLAFCSATGGTGCTTLAMAVCQEMMRFHDRRVFYVSMEELESTGCFIKGPASARTMGFYLYHLFKNRSRSGIMIRDVESEYRPFMESFVTRDDFGVEAFRPTKGRNPLVSLSAEEVCVFIESLMNCGRYDTIVIDTGTGLSPAAVTCLEMAERACFVSRHGENLSRETHFLQYLMTLGGDDILRKMVKVDNRVSYMPVSGGTENNSDEEPLLETGLCLGDELICTHEGEVTKVLLEGEFGRQIATLTNMLIEPIQ